MIIDEPRTIMAMFAIVGTQCIRVRREGVVMEVVCSQYGILNEDSEVGEQNLITGYGDNNIYIWPLVNAWLLQTGLINCKRCASTWSLIVINGNTAHWKSTSSLIINKYLNTITLQIGNMPIPMKRL